MEPLFQRGSSRNGFVVRKRKKHPELRVQPKFRDDVKSKVGPKGDI